MCDVANYIEQTGAARKGADDLKNLTAFLLKENPALSKSQATKKPKIF
jgi:hypothetical protein